MGGRFTLSRSERLRGTRTLSRLFSEGKGGFAYPFRYFWLADDALPAVPGRQDAEAPRAAVSVLFSVPKKHFKRAVKRNLLKRRSREAYRLNKAILTERAAGSGRVVSLALIYSAKEEADFKTIQNGVRKILAEVGKSL